MIVCADSKSKIKNHVNFESNKTSITYRCGTMFFSRYCVKMRDGRIYYSKCYLIKDLAQKAIKAMLDRADIKVIKARKARRATGVTPGRLAFLE